MTFPAEKTSELFSWNEYKDWPEDERWQIIDGHAYCMTPAPNIRHQKITGNFYRIIGNMLTGKPCVPLYHYSTLGQCLRLSINGVAW